ncbi:MAG: DNA-directed RNA polymerase subunit omega [Candidatus Brocadiales bacterium]
MENYYKLVEKLANQAGGHYRLTTALIKRVRQLVKGLSSFRSEPVNPVITAFEEYLTGKIQITEKPEELLEGKKKK